MVNENVSDRVTFETLWQKYIAEIAKNEPNRVFSKDEHDAYISILKENVSKISCN